MKSGLKPPQKRLGVGRGLGKTRAESDFDPKGISMAANKADHTATEMDYPAHERSYSRFLNLLKWSVLGVAIIAAVVIYIIGN